MKALIDGHISGGDDNNAVFRATQGIIYMGCPHMGDNEAWTTFLDRLAMISSKNMPFRPIPGINVQRALFRMLKECASKGEGKGMKSYYFYEVLPMDDDTGVLVPKAYATSSLTDNAPIHGTHTTMTQFVSKYDPGYQAVKNQILLWAQNCRTPDTNRLRATRVQVSCDLKKFHESNYDVDFPTFIEEAVVVTGEGIHVEATTTGEYLRRCWPDLAYEVIRALQDLEEVGPWSELPPIHKDTSPTNDGHGISITAFQKRSSMYFDITGSKREVQDARSALEWLCAGFQTNKYSSQQSGEWDTTSSLRFTSKWLTKGGEGSCWLDLFNHINVVPGLIAERPPGTPGLEISLDKIAALLETDRITPFSGNVFIKGFDAMLVLVELKEAEHVCVWHLLVNEDGEHICYTDERLQEIPALELELKGDMDFGRFRHIVGWYPNVENLTGQPSADYNSFKTLNLDPPRSRIVLDRFTLSGGQHINAGFSFALARRQKPLRGKPQTLYEKQIEWSLRQHVVFFDVDARRAWLVNGRSALLHLVRASLQRSRTMHKSFLLDPDAFEEAASTMKGTDAVDFVLQSQKNRMLKLFKLDDEVTEKNKVIITEALSPGGNGSTCELSHATEADVKYRHFKDEVGDVYNWLELIVAAAKDRNFEDGLSIHGSQLIGHDFLDLINGESTLEPKMIRLGSRGKSWIKSVREAHAITLFGSGFGELLKPLETATPLCSHWKNVPTGKDYLTVLVKDLKTSLLHDERHDIDQSQRPFESCDCDNHPNQGPCERGQILIRKEPSVKSGPTELPALPEEGAIILGQPDFSAHMMKSIVEFSTQVKKGVTDLPTRMRKRVSHSASVVS